MKVALIQDFEIKYIIDINESEIETYARRYQAVFDLSGFDPLPTVGAKFDGKTITNPPPQTKRITKLAMRQRFTIPELIGILTASKTDPMVEVLLGNMQVATFIDLARPDTVQGLGYLVSINLLTAQRMGEILNNPIQEIERYKEGADK